MALSWRQIKLKYSKFEFYALALLFPVAFFLFVFLLKFQHFQNNSVINSDLVEIEHIQVSVSDYPELESLSYKVQGNSIQLIHALNKTQKMISRLSAPDIQIQNNTISIKEAIGSIHSETNTSNKLKYTIFNINPEHVYNIRLSYQLGQDAPVVMNISLDLKSRKSGLILLNNEANVFQNLKYFVNQSNNL